MKMAAVLGKRKTLFKAAAKKHIFVFQGQRGKTGAVRDGLGSAERFKKINIAHGDFYLVSVLKEHQIPASNTRFRDFTRLSICSGL